MRRGLEQNRIIWSHQARYNSMNLLDNFDMEQVRNRRTCSKRPRLPSDRPQAARIADLLSKNSAWLTVARTMSGWNGLVIRKAGSGRSPVSSRSG